MSPHTPWSTHPTIRIQARRVASLAAAACAVFLFADPALAEPCPSGWSLEFRDNAVPQIAK